VPNERYRLANPFKVPLKGKNKTLVKILGSTPAGQILGGRDPCNPCGVDAYANGPSVPGDAGKSGTCRFRIIYFLSHGHIHVNSKGVFYFILIL